MAEIDLISRQAAIEAIKGFKQGAAEWRDEQEERSDIWHRADSAIASALEIGLRVKKLPSAQPKTGKWIDKDLYKQTTARTLDGYTYCDRCNHHEEFGYRSNFCPECGADMRGETDE